MPAITRGNMNVPTAMIGARVCSRSPQPRHRAAGRRRRAYSSQLTARADTDLEARNIEFSQVGGLALDGGKAPMSSEPGSYCYGRKLLDRVGWEMYLGHDTQGSERWEPITGVRITSGQVRITVADGTTYATGYADAVRCRRPERPGG